MRKSDGAFTPAEMRLALIALIASVALAIGGMALKELTGPPLGAYGHDLAESLSLPGVSDARPTS